MPHPAGKGKPFAGHKAPPFRAGQAPARKVKFRMKKKVAK